MEPEFDGWSSTLTLSGPLTDTLRGRLVVKREETDGYMDNKFLNQDERTEEDTVGRVILEWDATDTLTLNLKYETGESDTEGRQDVITVANGIFFLALILVQELVIHIAIGFFPFNNQATAQGI